MNSITKIEGKKLPSLELPSVLSVLEDCILNVESKKESTGKDPSVQCIADEVAIKVEELYRKLGFPLVTHQRVKEKIVAKYTAYRQPLRKCSLKRPPRDLAQQHEKFKETASQTFFDVCSCKCVEQCLCRTPLSSVRLRHLKNLRSATTGNSEFCLEENQPILSDLGNEDKSFSCESDLAPDTLDEQETDARTTCSRSLPNFAMTCDRYDISDRAAAALASALLADLQVPSEEDENCILVIYRSKVRRERNKLREKMKEDTLPLLKTLCFDGRKDLTLTMKQTPDGRWHRGKVREEHVVLVSEPDSVYLGHVTPLSGKAADLKDSLLDFTSRGKFGTDALDAVACDGTNVNVGVNGGVITLLEEEIQRPLQRVVCMLHMNELPLRHLMGHLDGKTTGPKAFSGPMGRQLPDCEMLPVTRFSSITTDIPDLDPKILSSDQRYLLEIVKAVSVGQCPEKLANAKPGPLNHARWLTLACRVLRLYIASSRPSVTLKTIAEFIMKVYAPQWFLIKKNPSCASGALHVFSLIQRVKTMPVTVQRVVFPVIKHNGFFAHSESILLAMLSDLREDFRKRAVKKIEDLRASAEPLDPVRRFTLPDINLDASNYTEMADLNSEPPFTRRLSIQELYDISLQNTAPPWEKVPCHTQAVERYIRVVTEAANAVCGQEARDGYIKAKIKGRTSMPSAETPRDIANWKTI